MLNISITDLNKDFEDMELIFFYQKLVYIDGCLKVKINNKLYFDEYLPIVEYLYKLNNWVKNGLLESFNYLSEEADYEELGILDLIKVDENKYKFKSIEEEFVMTDYLSKLDVITFAKNLSNLINIEFFKKFHLKLDSIIKNHEEYLVKNNKFIYETKPEINPSKYEINKDLYNKWKYPVFGDKNPRKQNNKYWKWLINTKIEAYQISDYFSSNSGKARWCFHRFGQTTTIVSDKKSILIGGEHEDYYDPDFCIYNDVVVKDYNGKIDIYGYPEEIFPPLDFHTATLVDNEIIIIGSLGYQENRKENYSPVYSLNIETFKITKLKTTGNMPGWIYKHEAKLSKNQKEIIISKGKTLNKKLNYEIRNNNIYSLNLETFKWKCVSQNYWPIWSIYSHDINDMQLFNLRSRCIFNDKMNYQKELKEGLEHLTKLLNFTPKYKYLKNIYKPKRIEFLEINRNLLDYNKFGIIVNNVKIIFYEFQNSIQMEIQGELENNIRKNIQAWLVKTLEKIGYKNLEINKIY